MPKVWIQPVDGSAPPTQVDEAEGKAAFLRGEAMIQEDAKFDVSDSTGGVGVLSPLEAWTRINSGVGNLESPGSGAGYQQEYEGSVRKGAEEGIGGQALSFGEGVASGATAGISRAVLSDILGPSYKERQTFREDNFASGVGEFGGMVGLGIATGGIGASGEAVGAGALKLATKAAAREAIEGAAYNAVQSASTAYMENKPLTAENIVQSAFVGGVFGGGVGLGSSLAMTGAKKALGRAGRELVERGTKAEELVGKSVENERKAAYYAQKVREIEADAWSEARVKTGEEAKREAARVALGKAEGALADAEVRSGSVYDQLRKEATIVKEPAKLQELSQRIKDLEGKIKITSSQKEALNHIISPKLDDSIDALTKRIAGLDAEKDALTKRLMEGMPVEAKAAGWKRPAPNGRLAELEAERASVGNLLDQINMTRLEARMGKAEIDEGMLDKELLLSQKASSLKSEARSLEEESLMSGAMDELLATPQPSKHLQREVSRLADESYASKKELEGLVKKKADDEALRASIDEADSTINSLTEEAEKTAQELSSIRSKNAFQRESEHIIGNTKVEMAVDRRPLAYRVKQIYKGSGLDENNSKLLKQILPPANQDAVSQKVREYMASMSEKEALSFWKQKADQLMAQKMTASGVNDTIDGLATRKPDLFKKLVAEVEKDLMKTGREVEVPVVSGKNVTFETRRLNPIEDITVARYGENLRSYARGDYWAIRESSLGNAAAILNNNMSRKFLAAGKLERAEVAAGMTAKETKVDRAFRDSDPNLWDYIQIGHDAQVLNRVKHSYFKPLKQKRDIVLGDGYASKKHNLEKMLGLKDATDDQVAEAVKLWVQTKEAGGGMSGKLLPFKGKDAADIANKIMNEADELESLGQKEAAEALRDIVGGPTAARTWGASAAQEFRRARGIASGKDMDIRAIAEMKSPENEALAKRAREALLEVEQADKARGAIHEEAYTIGATAKKGGISREAELARERYLAEYEGAIKKAREADDALKEAGKTPDLTPENSLLINDLRIKRDQAMAAAKWIIDGGKLDNLMEMANQPAAMLALGYITGGYSVVATKAVEGLRKHWKPSHTIALGKALGKVSEVSPNVGRIVGKATILSILRGETPEAIQEMRSQLPPELASELDATLGRVKEIVDRDIPKNDPSHSLEEPKFRVDKYGVAQTKAVIESLDDSKIAGAIGKGTIDAESWGRFSLAFPAEAMDLSKKMADALSSKGEPIPFDIARTLDTIGSGKSWHMSEGMRAYQKVWMATRPEPRSPKKKSAITELAGMLDTETQKRMGK